MLGRRKSFPCEVNVVAPNQVPGIQILTESLNLFFQNFRDESAGSDVARGNRHDSNQNTSDLLLRRINSIARSSTGTSDSTPV